VIFSILSAVVGVQTLHNRVLEEAQARVRLDLSSAWAVYNSQLRQIETILKLAATKELVVDAFDSQKWDSPELTARLEKLRVNFGLDFLSLVSDEGRVVLRTTPPFARGDYRGTEPALSRALGGETLSCMSVWSADELTREAEGLAEQAFLELENTRYARRTQKEVETRGMVMLGAVPVEKAGRVLGVVYGGMIVNRDYDLIDRMQDVVYKNERYKGAPLGTATIFLHDTRIATTVRLANGNRAIGTRVSKEVADRVLDNGHPWVGEAFVVNDRYLSAYEPIRDARARIIGMLYVGILKRPFQDYGRSVAVRYLVLSLFVLLVGLVLAFITAGRLAQPIHGLVEASNCMQSGERPPPVSANGACDEVEALIVAFNRMAETLAEREERLKALNRNYMETLGFVSHELKSPVATILNYVYLMKGRKIGELTEKQAKAVSVIDSNSHRLVEMVRHYLNLARIENRELQPVLTKVPVLDEVLMPIRDGAESDLGTKAMKLTMDVGADVTLRADLNMVREVFENLLSNAIKYGRQGGEIIVKAAVEGSWVRFGVRNEGEGIPAEKCGELFQKFSRLEGSAAVKQQKGTGLGLFITKHIVDAHGGTITVNSESGAWAEFTFTLPKYEEEGSQA
jgi:two-component system NtrC family sensor kinase